MNCFNKNTVKPVFVFFIGTAKLHTQNFYMQYFIYSEKYCVLLKYWSDSFVQFIRFTK